MHPCRQVRGATHRGLLRFLSRQLSDGASSRPFREMPGPRSLPLIGTLHNYLPLIGDYHFDRLHWNGAKKLAKYGPVVREEIVKGTSIVWLFDPEDIEALFRSFEGKHPQRLSHLALQHFRLSRPDTYNSGGLLPTNGPEWARLRTNFQQALSKPKNVRNYVSASDDVVKEFLTLIKRNASDSPAQDFLNELSRVALELIGLAAFDERMGGLEETPSADCEKLLEAAFSANSCILGTDNGLQLWKKFKTPLYKKLENALLHLEKVAVDFVDKKATAVQNSSGAKDAGKEGRPLSLLEQYLANPDLDRKDVIGMVVDMLLAGADTTTYSASFALYHLAVNPDKQRLLQQEAKLLLATRGARVTQEILSRASFTKAVLKEALRLNPVSVGVGRILQQDALFSGFQVPKGTVIVTQNQVTCRQAKYFERPDDFLPERWIRGHELAENINPFISLPFGHGPRACIAKRLAEQNIQILLLRIARDFHITWHGEGELDCKSLLINKPDKPLRLQFTPL